MHINLNWNTIVYEREITKIIACEIKVIALLINFAKTVLQRNSS